MNPKCKKLLPHVLVLIAASLLPVLSGGSEYLILLMCLVSISVISVSGLDLLFGYSGQISLGHAAFYAIGAYTSALLSIKLLVPVWISMFAGASLAALAGIIVAFPAAKLVHHFLALLTIALGQLTFIFVSKANAITNGMSGIINIPPVKIGSLEFDTNIKFLILIYILVFVFLYIKQRIVNSRVGRALIAIRDNTPAASGMGINVRYYKIMVFAISAFYTGFAGALYAHFIGFISPESFSFTQSVLFLTMLLFGGTGSLYGPVIGTVVLTIVAEYLQQAGSSQTLIYGLFILVVILFLPKGVYGIIAVIETRVGKMVKKLAEIK